MPRHTPPEPSKWNETDLIAMSALQGLPGPYVTWSVWSIRPAVLMTILNYISVYQPGLIVELGGGTSSIYIGRLIRTRGGRLITVEHDERWLEHTSRALSAEGLAAGSVELVHAPLVPIRSEHAEEVAASQRPSEWYDPQPLAERLDRPIDLLIIDGPPGSGQETLNRYPAIPVLEEHLAPDCIVVVDDADRAPEAAMIKLWSRRPGRRFRHVDHLGVAVQAPPGPAALWPK